MDTPEAKQRLVDAFWELLEDNRINEISVTKLVAKAGCNRGTFYYHYTDIDELTLAAVRLELLGDKNIPTEIFNLVTGTTNHAATELLSGSRMRRISLAMRHGGREIVEKSVKTVIFDIWHAVLCPDGTELLPETRAIIEYTSSGVLGLLSYRGEQDAKGEETPVPIAFFETVTRVTLTRITAIQGISQEEMLLRLKMFNELSRL